MSEWDQTGASATPRPTPGWDAGVPADPAWQERTLRGLAAGQVVFGRYRLERVLGQGGMGVVWLAADGELGHWVALKFLPEAVMFDPAALDDLRAETRRSLRLTHPNIVRVYHFERETSRPLAAISMELIEGQTLSALRMGRPNRVFEAGELLPWVRQLCAALDYAHGQGMVHRDLKPANLMVDGAGNLKVCDFGIACSLRDSITRATGRLPSGSGTLVYMSPQQMMGEDPAVTDDVYAIGATLYELLTGKPPFFRGDVVEQVKHRVPEPMAQRRANLGVVGEPIPAQWEAVVAGCLDKDAGKRPQSAGDVVARLEARGAGLEGSAASGEQRATRAESGKRNTGKRCAAAIAAGIVLALVGGAAWWFGLEGPRRETARATEEQKLAAETARKAEEAQKAAEAEKARLERERLAREEAQRQEVAERMANARGGLLVRTEPSGAMVRVDGGEGKAGPAAFSELKLGKHKVSVSAEGYPPREVEAEVSEGKVTEVGPVVLEALTAKVVMESPSVAPPPSGVAIPSTTEVGAAPTSESWNWDLVEIEGRDNVSLDQVAEFYRMPQQAQNGETVRIGSGDKGIELRLTRREAVVKGVRISLSFPVLERGGKAMISRMDLVKVIEPLMRPERVPNGKAFKTVVIDAGHGGSDSGERSHYCPAEKEMTLAVAKRLRPLLEAAGFKAVMTRIRDEQMDLPERAAVAESYENSIFVSIHFNSGSSEARGVETHVMTPAGAYSTASEQLKISDWQTFSGNANDDNNVLLAAAVHRRMTQLWKEDRFDLGVTRARPVELSRNRRPAILVCGGFVSNPEDAKLISNPDFQLEMAEHIKMGILDYQSLLNEGVVCEPGMRILMDDNVDAVEAPITGTAQGASVPHGGLPITTIMIGTNILEVPAFRPDDF